MVVQQRFFLLFPELRLPRFMFPAEHELARAPGCFFKTADEWMHLVHHISDDIFGLFITPDM